MSFIAPLFLFGLLSLLAPWLLHRLNERQAPVKEFPSDRFLETTKSISAQHKRLRYWFLLLLRLLALALLCLLFAQPVLKRFGFMPSEPATLNLVVLDQSFSMRQGDRWTRAQNKVSEVLSTLPANAPVLLMGVETQASSVLDETLDRDAVLDAVRTLQPGYASFDYAALMRQLNAVAERQTLPVVAHLFTDAQASAMPARLNDLVALDIEEVKLWNVVETPAPNLALSAEVIPLNDTQFSLDIVVRHSGNTDSLAAQKIVLQVPGEDAQEIALPTRSIDDLAAGADAEGKSEGAQPESRLVIDNLDWPEGDRLETYSLSLTPGDNLPDDDRLELPVQMAVSSRIQVLELSAGGRSATESDPWLFLSTALRLDHTNRVTRLRSGSTESLNTADMVVVVDDSPLDNGSLPDLSDRLQRYIDGGGTVLYVINESATQNPSQDGVIAADRVHRIDQVDQTHPLALDRAGWQNVAFYASQPVDSQGTEVLVKSTAGHAVLMETPREQGKLLWLNAPLNGSDNDLPISPVFVPFLRSVTDYYLRYDRYPLRVAVGETVKLGQSVQLLDPDGDSLLNLSQSLGGSVHMMSQPGIYTILDQKGEHPLEVRVTPRESDTRTAATETLAAWTDSATAEDQSSATSPNETATAESAVLDDDTLASSFALARWLLPLCVLFFFVEALVANYHVRVRRA